MSMTAKFAALASALLLGVSGAALAQSGGGGSSGGGSSGGSSAGASSGASGAAGAGGSASGGGGATGSVTGGTVGDGGAAGSVTGGNTAGAGATQPGGGGANLGDINGADANVPGAGGSNVLTQQPDVRRGIPGQSGTGTGATAGTSSPATGLTERQVRDRLRTQGFDDVTGLVRRGDVWEGQVMRQGRMETIRIDPLTGQAIAR